MDLSPFPRLTGTSAVSVRPAQPGDAGEIARVQLSTWRTAYSDVLPAQVLADIDEAAAAASWERAVSQPPTPGHAVLVALEKDTVVGFAAYGPAELGPDEEPHAAGPSTEIAPLLVEPRWGRRGHGSRLLAAVTDLARPLGVARLQIWLPERDQASAAFFESAGWAPDGWARTLDTGGGTLREQRWHTLLDEQPHDEQQHHDRGRA